MKEQKSSKGIHITLWVLQGLLAVAFFMAGFMKTSTPIEELAAQGMSVAENFSAGMIRFIGLSEILGAIGLILPAALRFKPILTVLAAAGLAIVMLSATIYHVVLSEPFVPTVVLFVLTAFVAWGRYKMAPIQEKE